MRRFVIIRHSLTSSTIMLDDPNGHYRQMSQRGHILCGATGRVIYSTYFIPQVSISSPIPRAILTAALVAPDAHPLVIPQLYIPEGEAGMEMMNAFATHGHEIEQYVAVEQIHTAYTNWAKDAVHVIALLLKEYGANDVLICTHGVLVSYLAEALARMVCNTPGISPDIFFQGSVPECGGFYISETTAFSIVPPNVDP
jgi:hypothetical protein